MRGRLSQCSTAGPPTAGAIPIVAGGAGLIFEDATVTVDHVVVYGSP